MILYTITSLEELAQLFEQNAVRASEGALRVKTKRLATGRDAEARTWQAAAEIVRATTLKGTTS
jgi:hypothetical protein